MINSIINLINEIIKNSKFKKIIVVIFALLPLLYLTINFSEFNFDSKLLLPLTISVIFGVIYFYVQLFKLIFDLTTIEHFKKEEKPMYLFWILVEFQIIFSIILLPLIFFLLFYLNNLPIFINSILNFLLLSLHNLLLIVIIGSRSLENISLKLILMIKDKFLLKIFFTMMVIIFSLKFIFYLNEYLKSILIFLILIFYFFMFVFIIREWQKVFFKHELSFSAE